MLNNCYNLFHKSYRYKLYRTLLQLRDRSVEFFKLKIFFNSRDGVQ